MIVIAAELLEVSPDLKALTEMHYAEIAKYATEFPLDINWGTYKICETLGRLVYVTVREDDILIGYYIGFLVEDIHSKKILNCSTDIFFIRKDKRKSNLGLQLFKYVEKILIAKGVTKWAMSSNIDKNTNALFKRIGAVPHEIIYSKILGAT